MAPSNPYTLNSTVIETSAPNNQPFYDFGEIFGIDALYLIIGCLLFICLCLSVLLLCIHRKKHNTKDNKGATETVNGMELQYKYSVKGQSFEPHTYKSSIAGDKSDAKQTKFDSEKASFDRVVNQPNTKVSQNPLKQRVAPLIINDTHLTHPPSNISVSTQPQPNTGPYVHGINVQSALHHTSVHSAPFFRPYYGQQPAAHPVMQNQPQSYPYPVMQQQHQNIQHQYIRSMPNASGPMHERRNNYAQNDEIFKNVTQPQQNQESESSSEYKTEFADTEYKTEYADTEALTPTETNFSTQVEVHRAVNHNVVDTLTTIVNNAKEQNMNVVQEDKEENFVVVMNDENMNMNENMIDSEFETDNISHGGSSMALNREPSQQTINTVNSPFARSQNRLV